GEVGVPEETAVPGREARQGCSHFPFVVAGTALRADRFERARERRIGELRAAAEEQGGGARVLGELGFGLRNPARKALADRIAVARMVDGGLQAARERQPAVARVRLAEARYRARRGERGRYDAAKGDLALAAKALERCRGRGAAAAVEIGDARCGRVVDQPERIAADAAHVRIDDSE